MNTTKFKLETIETNLQSRYEEAAGYEINIFNYEHLMGQADVPDDFKNSLPGTISANKHELSKVHSIIKALVAQQQYLNDISDNS